MAHRYHHHSRDDEENPRHGHKRQRLPEHHYREERHARDRARCEDRVRHMQRKEPELIIPGCQHMRRRTFGAWQPQFSAS